MIVQNDLRLLLTKPDHSIKKAFDITQGFEIEKCLWKEKNQVRSLL